MKRRYFGTDGVRGPYGGPLINENFATRLGEAVGRWLAQEKTASAPLLVLVGRDTRFSGASLEAALIGGLVQAGVQAVSLGVIPTPAVARAVRVQAAALGVVITASHNPAADNGIKFFGPGGVKLSDEEEAAIEALLPTKSEFGTTITADRNRGSQPKVEGAAVADYVAATARLLRPSSLYGWRIVLDTANGATCGTSPLALRQLGAEVIGVGDAPDGRNINAGVGSEHPEALGERVRQAQARLGVAHDGDGDRCVLCDERGDVLDGDEILTILAKHELDRGTLAANTLVITVQSNLGVDSAIAAAGGRVSRTPVGDRYVSQRMREIGATLGGESSGHIICAEVSPTGDGLVAALKVIGVMLETGLKLSELRQVLRKFPQRSAALTVKEKLPLESLAMLQQTMAELENELGERGRLLVRYSGTEPKLRLLVEGPDVATVERGLARLDAAVRAELAVVE